MGPNSINTFNPGVAIGTATAAAQASDVEGTQAARGATATNGMKIHYGDSIKADRLQAGLRGLQAAQAKTELYIRTINPELGKL